MSGLLVGWSIVTFLDVPAALLLTSQDHGNDEIETLIQIGDEEESRSSDASESDEEPSMRLADYVVTLLSPSVMSQ